MASRTKSAKEQKEKSSRGIAHAEYAKRRTAVLEMLDSAVGLLFSGEHDAHLEGHFRSHPHFEYLTGVTEESGAILLLDPENPVEARREVLFLSSLNPELERWEGERLTLGQALREQTGFRTIFRKPMLGRFLNEAVRRSRKLACLHPLATIDEPVSPDLELFRKVSERVPEVTVSDASEVMLKLRSVKSDAEIALIEQAINVTNGAFLAALRCARAGINESALQATFEHEMRMQGARGPAFDTIVGSGRNATVLHYKRNRETIAAGSLICIDGGAACHGYGADITRTIPADGNFTPRQREIYDIVLEAMQAAIDAVKPGVRLADIDRAARTIIADAGYGDAFIHSIGHHLGLETHDPSPSGTLEPGNVLTIEPGIYLPDEALGVRIEDDVVVTAKGCRNLSAEIVKTADEIERVMRGG